MYAALSTIRLGFDVTLSQLIDLAVGLDYRGVEPSARAFFGATDDEREEFLRRLRGNGLSWRLSALPGNLGTATDDRAFTALIAEVRRRAPVLAAAGAFGFSTWIPPADDALTFAQQFELHRERLNRLAPILREHGLRLGLEYVGPRPSRAGRAHPFVHTLEQTRELISSTTDPARFGLVLDTLHWYTAGESTEDLLGLAAEDILAVDVNDAVAGADRDDQTDELRALPGETGVIDAIGFFEALRGIGYQGPVVAEPLALGVADLAEAERVRRARVGLGALLVRTS